MRVAWKGPINGGIHYQIFNGCLLKSNQGVYNLIVDYKKLYINEGLGVLREKDIKKDEILENEKNTK